MNKKKVILGSGILVVLIVAMVLVWTNFREKPVEGSKAITIEVIDSKEKSVVYELQTDAEFLIEAMEEAKTKAKEQARIAEEKARESEKRINKNTTDSNSESEYNPYDDVIYSGPW